MDADPLRRILQQADAVAGPAPEMPEDLARRVAACAARRRRVRFSLSAAAAIMLAVGGAWLLWEPRGTLDRGREPELPVVQAPTDAFEIADLRTEIERLRREAELRLAVARRTQEILQEMRRAEALERTTRTADPIAAVRRQADQAAYVVVRQADRMCREMNLCDSAVVRYERVVRLFPNSRWAVVARQRIEQIKQKGDVS